MMLYIQTVVFADRPAGPRQCIIVPILFPSMIAYKHGVLRMTGLASSHFPHAVNARPELNWLCSAALLPAPVTSLGNRLPLQ